MHGLSYSQLAFHNSDSMSFRKFVGLGFGGHISKYTLQENIKKLKPETWEEIHKVIINYARKHNIEKDRKVRGDTSVVLLMPILMLKQDKWNFLVILHNYTNKKTYFPGLDISIIRLPVKVASKKHF